MNKNITKQAIDKDEYPIEYFEKQLYHKYIDAIFPDFHSENYEMTEKFMREIEKFHNEFSICTSRIRAVQELFKEIFSFSLASYFSRILDNIIKVNDINKKKKIIDDFELTMSKATNTINSDSNFRTKACLNTAKTKWKSHLYGIMVNLF